MPTPDPAALAFLLRRRSRPAKTLGLPVPSRDELAPILTAAARSPDHGKLEPWRFIVLETGAMPRLADLASERALALGLDDERSAKGRGQFAQGCLAVVVVARPQPSDKVPEIEQVLSVGAVCVQLLNAAEASGWGANWLTGWPAYDAGFTAALGVKPGEFVAGILHIGTETVAPPDRPRPDLAAITEWISS